ncbi:MAG: anti-sigma factor [Bryobacteraceae bacterium]|jgi:anti-sigma-K factor RskA
MSRCQDFRESFELYALGVLDPEEKAEIDAHLRTGCAACEASLKNALALNAIVMSLAPDVVPPARLKRRVLAGVGVHPMSWSWLSALAAACILVVALWLSVQERSRAAELSQARHTLIQVSSQRDRLLQALSFLDDPSTLPVSFGKGQPLPPRGNVFVHSKLGVLLIASNLPPAQAGKTYEMWVIPKGGAPRPAGLFQSEGGGTAMHILSGPLDLATLGAVAVTLEPEAGSSAPTSTPIIVAPVAGP